MDSTTDIVGNIRFHNNHAQVYTGSTYVDVAPAFDNKNIIVKHDTIIDIDGFEITGKQLKMLFQILVKQNPEILY